MPIVIDIKHLQRRARRTLMTCLMNLEGLVSETKKKSEQNFFEKTQYYLLIEAKSMYYLTGKYQKRLLYLLLGPLFLIMPFPLLHQVQNVSTPSFVVCSFVSIFCSHLNQGIISFIRWLLHCSGSRPARPRPRLHTSG